MLFFLIVGVFTGVGVSYIGNQADYTNSKDHCILFNTILRFTIIIFLFVVFTSFVHRDVEYLVVFPFTFGVLSIVYYIEKNIKYLVNRYIYKLKDPTEIDNYGKKDKGKY